MTDLGYDPVSEPRTHAEIVSGYLASFAIFMSLLSLAWHPLRLVLPAMLLSLIAAAMAGRRRGLAFAAVAIAATCFFLGMVISVVVTRPLW